MFFSRVQMVVPLQSKIVKKGVSPPDQFELSIAQALLELENNSDLKSQLRELYITKAKEIELFGKKVSRDWGIWPPIGEKRLDLKRAKLCFRVGDRKKILHQV